jgi:hypothetical protein
MKVKIAEILFLIFCGVLGIVVYNILTHKDKPTSTCDWKTKKQLNECQQDLDDCREELYNSYVR